MPDFEHLMKESAALLGGIYLYWGMIPEAVALFKESRKPNWTKAKPALPSRKDAQPTIRDVFTQTSNPYLEVIEELKKSFSDDTLFAVARDVLVKKYSWAVPTEEALKTIAKCAPIVEIGAGSGYWASLLRARGVAVTAYDANPMEKGGSVFTQTGESWTNVLQADESAVSKHSDCALLL